MSISGRGGPGEGHGPARTGATIRGKIAHRLGTVKGSPLIPASQPLAGAGVMVVPASVADTGSHPVRAGAQG
jgi:hypothetical protein